MSSFNGRLGWLGAVAAASIIVVAACEEFTTDALVRVDIQQAHVWPDTLDVAEIATVTVEVLDSEGRAIAGVQVDWQTTDSTVIDLSRIAPPDSGTVSDSLTAMLSALVAAQDTGSADIIAFINRPGFETAELTVPIAVVRSSWPDFITVTAVGIVGITADHADRALTGELDAAWQSSDPATLKVNQLVSEPLQATIAGYETGTAEVIIAIDGERVDVTEFRVAMSVSGMNITEASPWPESINVTNVDTVGVEIRDADGNPMPDVTVSWRSSNEVRLTVEPLVDDSTRAEVRTLSRGGAEVIASAGGEGFQAAEYRRWVSVLQKWQAVDAGHKHTCALSLDGTSYCWGRNTQGELGTGDYARRLIPEEVAASLKYEEIIAGGIGGSGHEEQAHSCGRLGVTVECWGSFSHGQLGDGSGPCDWFDSPSECGQPVPVRAVLGQDQQAKNLAVGGRHTCVGLHDIDQGQVLCWGEIDTTTIGWYATGGGEHVCTWVENDDTFCIGANRLGQLGNGTTIDTLESGIPVGRSAQRTLDDAQPSAGGEHTCAVRDNVAWCWGSNEEGQLGRSSVSGDCGGPECNVWADRVTGLSGNVDTISAGYAHTCALAGDDVYCWGAGTSGQLGDGRMQSGDDPVRVDGSQVYVSISAGGAHSCAVTADGSLYCWGSNDSGQLGNGSTSDAGVPVRVSEPRN